MYIIYIYTRMNPNSLFVYIDTVLRRHLTVQLHPRTVQALHNIRHLRHHILQVHQVLAITNIHLLRHLLLLALHTPLRVQCIHLRMLRILHPRNTHQMLVVLNIISHTVRVLQFIHLQIFRCQVQGKQKSFHNLYNGGLYVIILF